MKILISLPVYNEEIVLEKNARAVVEFCRVHFPTDECQVIISDNNSTDKTSEIGRRLADEITEVEYFYLKIDAKGTNTKGAAWKTAFEKFEADVYVVMDVDLAVELSAIELLVEAIADGYDMAIGSRYLKDSRVSRSLLRDIISATYRWLARVTLRTKISDFQCGFKAIGNKIKQQVLPKTTDIGYFLDTELTVLAEKQGFKIKEVPVNWSEFRNRDRKSRVNLFEIITDYLKKIWKLRQKIKQLRG